MAGISALSVVAQAVASLLSDARLAETDVPGADYPLVGAAALSGGSMPEGIPVVPALGVTVFPYRASYNVQRRPGAPRVGPAGERFRPSLLIDLHFLVTAWAQTAAQQMRLLGWAARVLEDTPIFGVGLLNRWVPPLEAPFAATESVEIVAEPLSLQDLVAIWEVNKARQQPSLGYVARMISIDSQVTMPEEKLVRSRHFDLRVPTP